MPPPAPPLLAFDASLLTGVDEIDSQHRNLVDLSNEAAAALSSAPTAAQVRGLVQELLSYAIYHFRTEETLMQQYGYAESEGPAAERHVQCHRRFAEHVVEVQQALDRGAQVDGDALVAYLFDWIREHIQGTDQHLAAFILERRNTALG